ncbi:uncharacterized protein [Pleurodeles waltl]|uniref:uncharacterized protein isoform X2 n=1 Tax=Pleurodeles waltl TaxID=8319 RepID=UPI003709471A
MFPHTGGGSWRSSLFPQDGSMPHPRDPRTAARANYPSNHQAYEAGSGWTQGWPNPAQWGYPCQQVPTPPYQSGWIPNVAPQPGVNCPPVGVPPPGVNWSGFPVVSYPVGQEENQNKEGGGDHVKNGCPEGSDLSLFLSHYCNPKPARHLVPVSIADKEQGVPDAKASVDSNDSENKSLLEKMDSAVKEGTKEQFADEKDGASKNTGIDLSRETPASPTSLEGDFLLEKTNIKANKDANRTDLQDLLITVAQEVGENNPDARTAAVLRKKEEIEREYEQNCRTFFLVAAMLLEREPSIEQTVVSALRKTLRELSKQCEQELQNFIERYDRGIIRC